MGYNVFYSASNASFCSCSQNKRILRMTYCLKDIHPKDIHIEQSKLPFCKHIMAVRIARITKTAKVIKESETKWSQRAIENFTHNVPFGRYAEHFRWKYKKSRKSKKAKKPQSFRK